MTYRQGAERARRQVQTTRRNRRRVAHHQPCWRAYMNACLWDVGGGNPRYCIPSVVCRFLHFNNISLSSNTARTWYTQHARHKACVSENRPTVWDREFESVEPFKTQYQPVQTFVSHRYEFTVIVFLSFAYVLLFAFQECIPPIFLNECRIFRKNRSKQYT